MKKWIMGAVIMAGVSGLMLSNVKAQEIVSPKEVASDLNRLIERAIDGQKGYQEAAEKTSSVILKAAFTAKSAERGVFAKELQAKVQDLGQNAEQTGSIAAAAHRAWIDTKTAVSGKDQDDAAVLGAVKTGESVALKEYKDALEKDLPKDIKDLIGKQEKSIQGSYDWAAEKLEGKKEDAKDDLKDKVEDVKEDAEDKVDDLKEKF